MKCMHASTSTKHLYYVPNFTAGPLTTIRREWYFIKQFDIILNITENDLLSQNILAHTHTHTPDPCLAAALPQPGPTETFWPCRQRQRKAHYS